MKKGYYLYVEGCGSAGVMKKIDMQMAEFKKHYDIEKIQINNPQCSALRRAWNVMSWNSYARDYNSAIAQLDSPDFVYIRRTYIDRAYLDFLSRIHEKWSECKIIVEQPVYPYAKDMLSTPYTAMQYVKELIYRRHYKDNIDRFVTYSDDEVILGVPTIRTKNGVVVDSIVPINMDREYDKQHINLIAVATLVKHHGYERIIEGMHQYYVNGGNRDIKLHIVGDGPEREHYTELIKNYHLDKQVIMYGAKYGSELNDIYAIADAGLSAFGAYKEGLDNLCTIKEGEYLAKGLPVIMGCDNELFLNEAKRYGLIYSNDNSVVDVNRIVEYLDVLYADGKPQVAKIIRQLAYSTVDNSVMLRPVVDYIGS